MPDTRMKAMVVIVTGGGSGFGEGICRAFAEQGAKVLVADINPTAGERVAGALRSHGARFCQVDVSRSDEMKALVDFTLRTHGRLDLMVNNAGMSHANQPMLNVPEEMFDRIFQVNVKSIYLSAIHCLPVFRRQGGGAFINVASTAGVRPRPGPHLVQRLEGRGGHPEQVDGGRTRPGKNPRQLHQPRHR